MPRRALRAGGDQLAADHERRVEPAFGQHARDQARRRGLAVRAGDRDAAPEAHQLGRASPRAARSGCGARAPRATSGLSRLDRAGHDDARRRRRRCAASWPRRYATPSPARRRVAALSAHVGARTPVAEVAQHFGDAAHADAADADEVHARAKALHDVAACWWHAAGVMRSSTRPRAGETMSATRSAASAWPARARLRPSPAGARDRRAVPHSALRESLDESLALRQQQRRAARRPAHSRVARLVVVDRVRERHQERRYAGRADLGQRQRTGAADDEIGPRVGAAMSSMKGSTRLRCRRGSRPRAPARHASHRTDGARNRRCARDAASASGTRVLSARAPWLPPSTSRRSGPSRPAEALHRRGSAAIVGAHRIADPLAALRTSAESRSARGGRNAPARGWSRRATRFCSCTISGMRAKPRGDAAGPAA